MYFTHLTLKPGYGRGAVIGAGRETNTTR